MGCPSEVEIGDNLVFSVCTHDPDTGVLTDADSVPTYRVYEDETATPILTGSMAKLDDANTTGFYSELIACTSGNGFENGKSYTIYIVATVDSDQGGICYSFKAYDHRKANVIQLGSATQSATDLKDLADTGYDPETHKVQGVVLADTVTTLTGHTVQTGDNFARLGAPAGASVSADVAAVKAETALIVADTNELQTDDYPTSIAAIKAETALIVADTNELQTDDIPGTLSTIAGYLDTEIAAILADTGELQTDLTNGGRLDLLIDAIKAITDNLPAKKNTALSNVTFPMVLSSDHITPATGKTVTGQISKDGGAYANLTNSVTEISAGDYKVNITATEMNATIVALKFTEDDCDATKFGMVTNP